jgi:biotin operon repressor
MSIRAIFWAFETECPTPSCKLVLLKLADNANDDGECFPSRPYLARHTGLSESSVRGCIKKLAESGLLAIIPRQRDGVNLPNVYRLHLPAEFCRGGSKSDRGVGQPLQEGGSTVAPEPIIEPTRESSEVSPPAGAEDQAPKRTTKGTRIPDEWEPSEADKQYARDKGLSWQEITFQAEKFVNFWQSKPGAQGVKVKWDATWRNWILSYIERNGASGAKQGRANDPNAFGVYGYANGASKPRRPQADDMRSLCYE